MQVGDIVWFDPSKTNVWSAFTYHGIEVERPFQVKISDITEDGAFDVTPILNGGAPDDLYGIYQLAHESQLSKEFPEASSADLLRLIEQLEWLSVEQKKISMKELLALFKENTSD